MDSLGPRCQGMDEVLPPPPWTRFPIVELRGGGAPTRILCGYFSFDEVLFGPLCATLPPLLHVCADGGDGSGSGLAAIV